MPVEIDAGPKADSPFAPIRRLVRPLRIMSSSCRLRSDLGSVLLSKARTLGSIAIAVRVSRSSEEIEAD